MKPSKDEILSVLELDKGEGWENAREEEKLLSLQAKIYHEIRKNLTVRRRASVLAGFCYEGHKIDIYVKKEDEPLRYNFSMAHSYEWSIDGKTLARGRLFSDKNVDDVYLDILPSISWDLALCKLARWKQSTYLDLKSKWDQYSI